MSKQQVYLDLRSRCTPRGVGENKPNLAIVSQLYEKTIAGKLGRLLGIVYVLVGKCSQHLREARGARDPCPPLQNPKTAALPATPRKIPVIKARPFANSLERSQPLLEYVPSTPFVHISPDLDLSQLLDVLGEDEHAAPIRDVKLVLFSCKTSASRRPERRLFQTQWSTILLQSLSGDENSYMTTTTGASGLTFSTHMGRWVINRSEVNILGLCSSWRLIHRISQIWHMLGS